MCSLLLVGILYITNRHEHRAGCSLNNTFLYQFHQLRLMAINHDTKQFKNGMKIESREHPTLPKATVAVIVENHIAIHPNAYK